jgi:hypothetical protein
MIRPMLRPGSREISAHSASGLASPPISSRATISDHGLPMKQQRPRGPALTKAELRAQAIEATAAATKPIVKLPTKHVRQCGRCGEFTSVMVEPGQEVPKFTCKVCDKPAKRT